MNNHRNLRSRLRRLSESHLRILRTYERTNEERSFPHWEISSSPELTRANRPDRWQRIPVGARA